MHSLAALGSQVLCTALSWQFLFQMNGLNCSVTRRRRQDLNRRKVAAISFLANITVEGEAESDLPRYGCRMGTYVIDSYRRN